MLFYQGTDPYGNPPTSLARSTPRPPATTVLLTIKLAPTRGLPPTVLPTSVLILVS